MECPKCGAEALEPTAECASCGLIFAKYARRESWRERSTSAVDDDAGEDVAGLLLGLDTPSSKPALIGRAVFLAVIILWTTSLASMSVSAGNMDSFMHLPNLVFHEAGHILFSPLGRFMTVFGGSLTQVLVPLVCAGAFLWQTRDPFGASIAIWWAGQSLTDLAPYINDARDLQLVLLGGKTGSEVEGHDWEYILNALGVSHRNHAIAHVVQIFGTLTMIAALVWAALVVVNQWRSAKPQ